MSLGAIDFGLIVDSSVIMIENCVRRLAHEGGTRPKLEIIRDAAIEVRKPTMFGELIIAIVYLPILALQGTEGKLFRPMALTVIFALAGSLVLSLTLMPVLASLGLSDRARGEGSLADPAGSSGCTRRCSTLFVRHPVVALLLAVGLVGASVPVGLEPGRRVHAQAQRGRPPDRGRAHPLGRRSKGPCRLDADREASSRRFPEVRLVYCKTGRPEIANDVMGVHQTDVWTMLKPQDEWRPGLTRDALIEEMDKLLTENVPGVKFGFSQPIEMRVNELVAGVKSDVAVLIYGPDLDVLRQLALEVERVLAQIPGGHDIKVPTAGPAADAADQRSAATSSRGTGSRRPTCSTPSPRWAAPPSARSSRRTEAVPRCRSACPSPGGTTPRRSARSAIVDPKGRPIALQRPGRHRRSRKGPARSSARTSSAGRSSASTSGAATSPGSSPRPRPRSTPRSSCPPGYMFRWGGQFEHLQTASQRLMIVVPVAMLLDLPAALQHVPLDAAGRPDLPGRADGGHRRRLRPVLRGLPFSISAGVGFIALFGVAVLNGLVWVSAVEHLRQEGIEPHEAAREAALVRLRPILMTALVAGFGFIPMALATTPGAEIQRPLATVVIGGLITSTLLTALVLPAIYPWIIGNPRPSPQ